MNIVVKISRKYTNFTIYTLHACAEWNVLTQDANIMNSLRIYSY